MGAPLTVYWRWNRWRKKASCRTQLRWPKCVYYPGEKNQPLVLLSGFGHQPAKVTLRIFQPAYRLWRNALTRRRAPAPAARSTRRCPNARKAGQATRPADALASLLPPYRPLCRFLALGRPRLPPWCALSISVDPAGWPADTILQLPSARRAHRKISRPFKRRACDLGGCCRKPNIAHPRASAPGAGSKQRRQSTLNV